MPGEQPFDPSRLDAAQRAGEKILADAVTETEALNDYYNVDRLTDREQIRAMGIAHHALAGDAMRALTGSFPDLIHRATELWNEVETALHELEQSKNIDEDRRCLREILFNEAKLAKLLIRPQDEAAEG